MTPRPLPTRRCVGLTTIGGLLVGAIAAAPSAGAATRHASPQHVRFTVHGVVVASRSNAVTVFASDLVAGRRTEHNRRVTIALSHQTKTRGRLVRGHTVQVSGTAAVTSNAAVSKLTGLAVTSTVTQLHFYLGQVTAVGAGTLTVTKDAYPSDDPAESGRGSFTVDVSDAAVTVDGANGKAAVGDQVAVVGFSTQDSVVAMAVYAFTQVSDAVLGTVSSVDGSTVTVSVAGHPCSGDQDGDSSDDRDGDDDGDDDGDGGTGTNHVSRAALHSSYEHDGWHGSHHDWHHSHDGWHHDWHGSHDGRHHDWHGSHDDWRGSHDGWRHGDHHHGSPSVAVDVSDSTLVVDGQSDAATSLIVQGDQLVAFGTSTSTGMAASLTLVISANAS